QRAGSREQRKSRMAAAPSPPRRWTTLNFGLLGSALAWLALPPVGWWPLSWVAPIPWLLLIRRKELPGRRPYLALWLAGFAFWMATLHWLRLPHAATSIGWVALSAYLAVYLPIFVGLARMAVHQVGCSLLVAAPTIWAGLEVAQSHMLTGLNLGTLGHSQYRWIELIQISDLCGGYGVSFLIVLVAAAVARALPLEGARWTLWPAAPAIAALAAALVYGHLRMAGEHTRPGLKVALIQGSVDIDMKLDRERTKQIYDQYLSLSKQALTEHKDIDLIVWPETMFRDAMPLYTQDVHAPEGVEWSKEKLLEIVADHQDLLKGVARRFGVPSLLGMDTVIYGPGVITSHNSAVLLDEQGKVEGRYDKMRPVMFGEYVPFAQSIPWLYKLTPLEGGLTPGEQPVSLPVRGGRVAPSICFETFLPHFIRGQVATLREQGEEPDLLVNLTNDGWFWGSSELDLHLMAGAIRAVECRKPLAVAANTGFSAVIDADGRIVRQGPRREMAVLVEEIPFDTRTSPYVRIGDVGAGACLLFAISIAGMGGYSLSREKIARRAT
ncbi:MAG TPA: apolipoprotein N-acyltransferase, partial [Pirellulales bacterium]